jgi:Tfp pilus assembly protein PilF
MAVLYLDEGMTASAQESAAVAINELKASGELLAEAARAAAGEGYTNEAVVLWMAAFHREPDNPAIRNDAGQYIYRQMSNPAFSDITEIQSYVEQFPNSPFARTMVAQAMISGGQRAGELRTRQASNLLEQALSQNDTFAEAHLVYGNLYEAEDDIESATEAWRFAASFTNSPEWVQREANLKLDNYSSQEN